MPYVQVRAELFSVLDGDRLRRCVSVSWWRARKASPGPVGRARKCRQVRRPGGAVSLRPLPLHSSRGTREVFHNIR